MTGQEISDFSLCTSLTHINLDHITVDSARMQMLDNMSFEQIQWCKNKGLIQNLPSNVAKELNMCAFFVLIDKDLISEFDKL
jgi:hypothetical protein